MLDRVYTSTSVDGRRQPRPPALVLLATVVLRRNDLVLLAIGSAFVWLSTITVCAAFWWAAASVGGGSQLVLAVSFGAPVQEISRWLTYVLYLQLLDLRSVGLPPGTVLYTMAPAAVANGMGIGLMQTLVMHGEVATRSLLPGSLYTDACAGLSLFAVDALRAASAQPARYGSILIALGASPSQSAVSSPRSLRGCRAARVSGASRCSAGLELISRAGLELPQTRAARRPLRLPGGAARALSGDTCQGGTIHLPQVFTLLASGRYVTGQHPALAARMDLRLPAPLAQTQRRPRRAAPARVGLDTAQLAPALLCKRLQSGSSACSTRPTLQVPSLAAAPAATYHLRDP